MNFNDAILDCDRYFVFRFHVPNEATDFSRKLSAIPQFWLVVNLNYQINTPFLTYLSCLTDFELYYLSRGSKTASGSLSCSILHVLTGC